MHLKSLVLKGFKSFADRSTLVLEPGITAVVGPNGSGKSNISDAVLWVLGERNAKNLRGQVMEDVIFAGSSARKSVGVAEVTLVLDNSDGSLPVDYEEVAITRRMYRSGESEYLINNTVARRMDVLDILHDSGLGTGTHSIISQGHLDSILQSKPEDRRALIEEAAGVLKHKQRKAKSQRKLEQMDQHLVRVRDVAAEVERQLGPLQRKARRAEQYQQVSGQLSQVKLQLAVDDLRILKKAWEQECEKEAAAVAKVEGARQQVAQAEADFERLQKAMNEENADIAALMRKQSRASSAADRLDSARLVVAEKRRSAQDRAVQLQAALDENAQRRTQANEARQHAAEQLDQVRQQKAQAAQQLESAQAAFDAAAKARAGLESQLDALSGERSQVERDVQQTRTQLARAQEALAAGEGRLQALRERAKDALSRRDAANQAARDAEAQSAQAAEALAAANEHAQEAKANMERLRGQRDGARAGLEAQQEHLRSCQAEVAGLQEVQRQMLAAAGPARRWLSEESPLASTLEPLTAHLSAEEGYEVLVERLLGADAAALVARDSERARAVQLALKGAGKEGQVVLLLQDAKRAADAAHANSGALPSGCEPLLSHVRAAEGSSLLAQALLGDVAVCETLEEALRAASLDGCGLRFATRDGAVVYPGGKVVLGAAVGQVGDGALATARRLAEAGRKLEEARAAVSSLQVQADEAAGLARAAQDESLAASQKLAELRGKAESAQVAQRTLAKQAQKAALAADSAQKQLEEEERAALQRQPQVDAAASHLAQLEQRLEDMKARVGALQEGMAPAREEESRLSSALNEARVASATLAEREAFAMRAVETQTQELVLLSKADEASLSQLGAKQRARKRTEPLMDVLERLADAARDTSRGLASKVADAQEATVAAHDQAGRARENQRRAQEGLDALSQELSQIRIQKGQLEVRVQAAADAIVNDCGASMEEALSLPELEDRRAVEDQSFKLQRRIANMGTINPDAAQEYAQLKERFDYLKAQLDDLAGARSALKRIDRIIDARMRDDFSDTFEKVNQNFKEIFATLFPGGSAELSLVDPDDLENTGVEVKAQPRGKRITKMTLMSGGEKSLVACALLFAVYRTRSTPFYILDEIEAALDDSNLRRLTAYLSELRSTTQLIMITHQRRTMEMADVLFGVSMQADGVTKVISQRLEGALNYAE